jgi:phosphoribosylaminoimidazole-succinocarboxamide synthase
MEYQAIKETNFEFSGKTAFTRGKVRDIYEVGEDYLLFVVSDRISAFDIVLPEAIPYKGEILNLIAAKFLRMTEDIVPNWLISVPDPAISVGYKCMPFPVEMVIRGYLVGHAWREYKTGKRSICGVSLAENLKENQQFENPIITPTTKAVHGHDEDISRDMIIKTGLVSEKHYQKLEQYTLELYQRGLDYAAERGLILVDTKYEFGLYKDEIILIDEVHTPDSSRYFYAADYGLRFAKGQAPRQLSKEFVREWLMENNFMGREHDLMPEMTPAVVQNIMNRYVELYEKVTAEAFPFSDRSNLNERLQANIDHVTAEILK